MPSARKRTILSSQKEFKEGLRKCEITLSSKDFNTMHAMLQNLGRLMHLAFTPAHAIQCWRDNGQIPFNFDKIAANCPGFKDLTEPEGKKIMDNLEVIFRQAAKYGTLTDTFLDEFAPYEALRRSELTEHRQYAKWLNCRYQVALRSQREEEQAEANKKKEARAALVAEKKEALAKEKEEAGGEEAWQKKKEEEEERKRRQKLEKKKETERRKKAKAANDNRLAIRRRLLSKQAWCYCEKGEASDEYWCCEGKRTMCPYRNHIHKECAAKNGEVVRQNESYFCSSFLCGGTLFWRVNVLDHPPTLPTSSGHHFAALSGPQLPT